MADEWTDFFRIIPEVNAVMNWRDKRADSDQLAYDFAQRQKDPNYVPDLTKYNDSTIGMTANELWNKQQQQTRQQKILDNFAPAYSRYESDVSQNPNVRRAEVLAYQLPEDQNTIVQGSSMIPHIAQLTGSAPSEQNLYENNLKMTDRSNYTEQQRQMAGLLKPSARTGKYDDQATILSDFTGAAQDYPVAPSDQKGLFDQLQQSMKTGFAATPSVIPIAGVRGGKQTVIPNRYGGEPIKLMGDRGSEASNERERYQLITDDEGNVSRVNMDTGEATPVKSKGKSKSTAGATTRTLYDDQGNVIERTVTKKEGGSVGGHQSSAPRTMTATNPTTGQKIMSTDGGKSWQPAR